MERHGVGDAPEVVVPQEPDRQAVDQSTGGAGQLLRERDIPFSPIAEMSIGSVIVFRDPDNIQLEFWYSNPTP